MKDFKVTITGADDKVNPQDLVALSQTFPFVEWAILFSDTRVGPRYPTKDWVKQMTSLLMNQKMHLSLHACGALATRVAHGDALSLPMYGFERCQINGFDASKETCRLGFWWQEFILQMKHESELPRLLAYISEAPVNKISILSDASQGRGIQQASWPTPPPGVKMGWAGGIGPDNVDQVLQMIIDGGSRVSWIDMESRVRDEHDQLDLGKVRQVLECVSARYAELNAIPGLQRQKPMSTAYRINSPSEVELLPLPPRWFVFRWVEIKSGRWPERLGCLALGHVLVSPQTSCSCSWPEACRQHLPNRICLVCAQVQGEEVLDQYRDIVLKYRQDPPCP